MRLKIVAAALALYGAGITYSFAICSKPDAPSCAGSYGKFDDEWEFDRCKREMENFQSEVNDYAVCIQRDAKREIEEAASEYSDAVDAFNNRAHQ